MSRRSRTTDSDWKIERYEATRKDKIQLQSNRKTPPQAETTWWQANRFAAPLFLVGKIQTWICLQYQSRQKWSVPPLFWKKTSKNKIIRRASYLGKLDKPRIEETYRSVSQGNANFGMLLSVSCEVKFKKYSRLRKLCDWLLCSVLHSKSGWKVQNKPRHYNRLGTFEEQTVLKRDDPNCTRGLSGPFLSFNWRWKKTTNTITVHNIGRSRSRSWTGILTRIAVCWSGNLCEELEHPVRSLSVISWKEIHA